MNIRSLTQHHQTKIQDSKFKIQNSRPRSRGQTLVELSLTLPILMILMSVVVEGGLALNAWLKVNTAARDATRFVMDSGRPSETASLVTQKLQGIDFGSGGTVGSPNLNVYIIAATTDANGNINNWTPTHPYGSAPDNGYKTTQSAIQTRLSSQGFNERTNATISIVEVDYIYTPIIGTLLANGALIPMTSYAMVQEQQ